MKLSVSIFVTLFSLLLLVSCHSMQNKSNPIGKLTATTWVLSQLKGSSINEIDFAQGIPNLQMLADGKLSGFTGCNQFSGTFKLQDQNIQLDPGAMTRKACPGPGENHFLEAINKIDQFKLKNQKLQLLQGKDILMEFLPK